MENGCMSAMNFRYACKLFNETKIILDEDIMFILEAGRKSPSAFGMEPWKFIIITNKELKNKLQPLCDNQPQISSCSHLIIILAAISDVKVESGEVENRLRAKGMSQEAVWHTIEIYKNHLKDVLNSDQNIYQWTSRQTFIATANMMTAAASLEIDSCPIERFDKNRIEELLNLNTTQYQLSLVLPLGYRAEPRTKQVRQPLEKITEFIQ